MNGHMPVLDSEIQPTKKPIEIDIPPYGVCIAESHHERQFTMEPMQNPYVKIYFIIQGAGNCHIEGNEIVLEAGHLLIIPRNAKHFLSDHPNNPLSLYIIAVEYSCLQELASFRNQLNILDRLGRECLESLKQHDYVPYEIPSVIRKILHEQRSKAKGYVPAIQSHILNLVISINRAFTHIPAVRDLPEPNDTHARILRVADYCAAHFYKAISVEEMASMACLGIRQFTNQFKAVFGVTFMQFLHYHRVRFAQRLLVKTDRQITSICFESGFNDLAHFYRVFKKITGYSPRKYRLYAPHEEIERAWSEDKFGFSNGSSDPK